MEEGMRTLWDDGLAKVAAGLTSIEELARVTIWPCPEAEGQEVRVERGGRARTRALPPSAPAKDPRTTGLRTGHVVRAPSESPT